MKILSLTLLALCITSSATAATYHYDGDMPPAKMALDMMEVMGAIERLPEGYNYPPQYGSRRNGWGKYGALSGLYSRSGLPMSSMPGLGGLSGFGNLYNPMMIQGLNPAMAAPQMMNPLGSMTPPLPGNSGNSLWSTDNIQQQMSNDNLQQKLDEVTRLLQSLQGQPNQPATAPPQAPAQSAAVPQPVPSFDGVWISSNQDQLLVQGNQFMWTDATGHSYQGYFQVSGDLITTQIPAYNTTMVYRYRIEGDRLVAVTHNGLRYEFTRARSR